MGKIFLLLLLAGSWCAQAQHTLRGSVQSAQQPLEGAHIHIENLHAVAAPDGGYELHGLRRTIVGLHGKRSGRIRPQRSRLASSLV